MSGSGSFYVYILGYIVVVYCISLWRGVSVNDTYYYLDMESSSTATTTLISPQHLFHQNEDLAV